MYTLCIAVIPITRSTVR